jgi:hypothetical protein
MPAREPVQLTSLDASFDDAMKELLGGSDVRSATAAAAGSAPQPPRSPEALAYLKGAFGLEPLPGGPPAVATRTGGLGGLVRRVARKLFVSRTYHATLITMLADVAERQAAQEARLNALAGAQSLANERAARVVFRLWGDYNHLVRVVLDHHVNNVFGAFERHFEAFQEHFHAFEKHFGAFEKHFGAFEKHFGDSTATVAELTAALRALEQSVHEIQGPHDELVRSVSELLAARAREEALARRIEALEDLRDPPARADSP